MYGEFVKKNLVSACGKTVWGNPTDIGKVSEGALFDAVLDNIGKDLDALSFVDFDSENLDLHIEFSTFWFCCLF